MSLARSYILLIEDDPNDTFLFQRTLRAAAYSKPIQTVTNGEDAMAYLEGQGQYGDRKTFPMPGLIFLDLKLPGLSGFEVLTWIRQQPKLKKTQIVVLTGSPLTIDIYQAYELGANAYLVKPIRVEDVVALPKKLSQAKPILPTDSAPSTGAISQAPSSFAQGFVIE